MMLSAASLAGVHEAGRGFTNSALAELVLACAPLIAPDTALALVQTESAGNPFAIGVVGNALTRQARKASEALATAAELDRQGWDYSLGLAQINRRNFSKLGLTPASALEPCANLRAMQTLLVDCFARAGSGAQARPAQTADANSGQATQPSPTSEQLRLRKALSCYYSGNFRTGFTRDLTGQPPYVERVMAAWSLNRDNRDNRARRLHHVDRAQAGPTPPSQAALPRQ
jgi:type IV secretion system protein VirB1